MQRPVTSLLVNNSEPMSEQPFFVAALWQWVRTNPRLATDCLDKALEHNPNYANRTIKYRTNFVTVSRSKLVRRRLADGAPEPHAQSDIPASAERLVHWTPVEPDVVFEEGLVPPIPEDSLIYMPRSALDVGAYVKDSRAAPSVFVSTARYYQTSKGLNTRWQPRQKFNRYEYEIFAHGGIDINLTLGSEHEWSNQREVAFVGGIAPMFIRSARQYSDDAHPKVIRVWENNRFNPMENGKHLRPNLTQLPPMVYQERIPVKFWPSYQQPLDTPPPPPPPGERNYRRPTSTYNVMREAGELINDDLLGNSQPHMKRAVLLVPNEPSQAYFFTLNQYVRIKSTPGRDDDNIMNSKPRIIIDEWPSLRSVGFGKVDAVVPSPNGNGETYFFFATLCALVRVARHTIDSRVITGRNSIAIQWPSLEQAGFTYVDAAFPNPNNKEEIYFFFDKKYALIKVDPATHGNTLISGPHTITVEWSSLRKAGFKSVDAVLPSPDGNGNFYFFSGPQYVSVKIKPGTTGHDDELVDGPKSVATEWSFLRRAGFY